MLILLAVLSLTLALAAPASATVEGQDGTVVVTGTDGRDEIDIVNVPPVFAETLAESGVIITGTTEVKADPGQCVPRIETRSGRPNGFRCLARKANFDVRLLGGDDILRVNVVTEIYADPRTATGRSLLVAGGAGADAVTAVWDGTTSLRGDDGDDGFLVPFTTSRNGQFPSAYDGGAGRDTVDLSFPPAGVTVNLATGAANLPQRADVMDPETGALRPGSGSPRFDRVDTLAAVERVLGTTYGDSLTGGPAADDLFGQGGADSLNGQGGNDLLDGGPGSDSLDGEDGADTFVGGTGVDVFQPSKTGGETYNSRDGFTETVTCAKNDTVLSDLADKVAKIDGCSVVQEAPAKHKFDTSLSRGVLRVAPDGGVTVRIGCPALKTETCIGSLKLRAGTSRGAVLATTRYNVPRGRAVRRKLVLSSAQAKLLRRKGATLDAAEIDDDKRPRRILTRSLAR